MYFLMLKTGSVMIMDELDLHLHSMIVPELIKLFTDKKSNPRKVRLLFTCQNNDLKVNLY